MLVWKDIYNTGLEDIDNHHKSIFKQINKLSERVEKGEGLQTVGAFIKFMGSYVRLHFIIEERCMKRYTCPLADKNKEAHTKFLDAFNRFQQRLNTEGVSESLVMEVHDVAENWLTNHIIRIDTKLQESVEEQKDIYQPTVYK
jgi:hemerythrin-like metal-binding protein